MPHAEYATTCKKRYVQTRNPSVWLCFFAICIMTVQNAFSGKLCIYIYTHKMSSSYGVASTPLFDGLTSACFRIILMNSRACRSETLGVNLAGVHGAPYGHLSTVDRKISGSPLESLSKTQRQGSPRTSCQGKHLDVAAGVAQVLVHVSTCQGYILRFFLSHGQLVAKFHASGHGHLRHHLHLGGCGFVSAAAGGDGQGGAPQPKGLFGRFPPPPPPAKNFWRFMFFFFVRETKRNTCLLAGGFYFWLAGGL